MFFTFQIDLLYISSQEIEQVANIQNYLKIIKFCYISNVANKMKKHSFLINNMLISMLITFIAYLLRRDIQC